MPTRRPASQKGIFYPDSCTKLTALFQTFNTQLHHPLPAHIPSTPPRAIIVPHAGYIYSGYTANIAYHFASHGSAKRIIVIGPSHHYPIEGISATTDDYYETPCGDITIDIPYLEALKHLYTITFVPQAHQKEHSTEVQMPFVKYYFPHAKVLELLYGSISTAALAKLITLLLQDTNNLIVISSDLSHFYPLDEAKTIDQHCIEGIKTLDNARFTQCEACGHKGIHAMLFAAKASHLSSHILDYRTSAAYRGDTHSVVGYLSVLFTPPG